MASGTSHIARLMLAWRLALRLLGIPRPKKSDPLSERTFTLCVTPVKRHGTHRACIKSFTPYQLRTKPWLTKVSTLATARSDHESKTTAEAQVRN
jgi:hypothetical protein